MTNDWPWMAVAGIGALHGLNPASGWMFAAAWGVQSRDSEKVRHALMPIGLGHVASVAIVAFSFAQGLSMNRALVQDVAGALLIGAASIRLLRGAVRHAPIGNRAGHTGIALWSFLMATAHGSGSMLVPALSSMCLAANPAREITASGSLVPALAAAGVHMAAMLVTTGVIAIGVCRGAAMCPRLLSCAALRQAWTAALALTGVLLVALH